MTLSPNGDSKGWVCKHMFYYNLNAQLLSSVLGKNCFEKKADGGGEKPAHRRKEEP